MAIFKCKMCGGQLEIGEGETVVTCDFCETRQTLPRLADEKKANLIDRANHFRRNNDFDKAMGIYEQILNEDTEDAESYWSIVLCRYGIEYVEDPASHKRIPTVNRAQFTSVFDDEDYKSAITYADAVQESIYEAEASAINEIQKGILAISEQEEPFDVFICYKETDHNGRRTPDSVLATELYHELTKEGFKVFFSRITLEDKLGTAYEPYIFAALHSAKVMVVLGTKSEYFNAVWVKNEWARYLALIKSGVNKILIPAYRDMDPYDLPEEFSHLQAQDMGKLGFMQDLVRGIQKIVFKDSLSAVKETVVVQNAAATNSSALIKRGYLALEDGEWDKADDFFEQALNQDAEDAQAYLGKLMAELHVKTKEDLKKCKEPFDNNNQYKKVIRFGNEKLKSELTSYISYIKETNELNRLENAYSKALQQMNTALTEGAFKVAAAAFREISGYKDSKELSEQCLEKAEIAKKNKLYDKCLDIFRGTVPSNIKNWEAAMMGFNHLEDYKDSKQRAAKCAIKIEELKHKAEEERKEKLYYSAMDDYKSYNIERIENAIKIFGSILEYKDSNNRIQMCKEKIVKIERDNEKERLEKEKQEQIQQEERAKRNKKIAMVATSVICVIVAFVILLNTVILPNIRYQEAIDALNQQKYLVAMEKFYQLGDFKDAKEQLKELMEDQRGQLQTKLSAKGDLTVGVNSDGTAIVTGKDAFIQHNEGRGETDVVAVAVGEKHIVYLKSDGTVDASAAYIPNDAGQKNVEGWRNIVAIAAGDHTVGLKADGTVVAVGDNGSGQCGVSNWTHIVAISAGDNHTVGLKSDGTVIAVGSNEFGRCGVSDWSDIVAISAGKYHTVGLKSDGTVVATKYTGGGYYHGQCDVSDWKDIVAISAGGGHTVGLKSDGTVVAVGHNSTGLKGNGGACDVQNWNDIIAISAGDEHTVGLKADGTVVAVGNNSDGQIDVQDWDLF